MTIEAIAQLNEALRGRYRIVRPLGAGGMATVYLAEDLRHDRKVAFKVLRPDFAATLGSRRFLEEIRIAANLTHPHIMPVHDSGEAAGLLFYVMPFSREESLREWIDREGELPVEDAVTLLEEIVDAVGHAHSHGVVHRDIKPGNVLLQGGHAMIVDFGVAKALSEVASRSDGESTAEGMAIGTPAYMAPEQAAADPSVDHRADLYAIGILAYELLAGRPPFGGGTAPSILTRQITEAPVPVHVHRDTVTTELSEWVMRCLQKKPADRWKSAGEMLTALRALEPTARGTGSAMPAGARGTRRARPVGLFAAAGAVMLSGIFLWPRLGGADIDQTSRVVVNVFVNRTGDADFDPVGHMLQDWIIDGLLQSGLLEVVPTITARQAADYIGSEGRQGRVRDPIRALADETGADIVVSGTLYQEGDQLRIQTSVTDASNREEARLVGSIAPVVGSVSDVTPLFDEVRGRLLGSLATSLNRRIVAQVGVSDRAPTYAAYEALNRALDRYAARDYTEASALFLRAHELDSTYVVPLVYASLSLRNHGEWARSDSVVSLLEAHRDELSEYQRHWVDYSRAVLAGDLDRARVTIRRAATLAPGSKAAYNWSLMAIRMGRPAEAREALASLDPDRGSMRGISRYWMRQIEASHHLGDHERELEQVEQLEARYPDERSILFYKVRVLAALGWVESLKAVFSAEAVSRFPPDVVAVRYRNAAIDLFVHGHTEAAKELARIGIEWIDSRTTTEGRMSSFDAGVSLRARQQLLYQKGRLLEVLGQRAEALAIYADLYEQTPDAWFLRAHMGVVHASLGHISEAMETDRWLQTLDVPYDQGSITTWRAGIAGRLGDLSRGTALLHQARQEGVAWADLHPLFHLYDAMGAYDPFMELMAPQG